MIFLSSFDISLDSTRHMATVIALGPDTLVTLSMSKKVPMQSLGFMAVGTMIWTLPTQQKGYTNILYYTIHIYINYIVYLDIKYILFLYRNIIFLYDIWRIMNILNIWWSNMILFRPQVFEASGLKSQLHFPKRPAIEMGAGGWKLGNFSTGFVQLDSAL